MTKVKVRLETTVKLMLKSFQISAFAERQHPDDAVDQYNLGF